MRELTNFPTLFFTLGILLPRIVLMRNKKERRIYINLIRLRIVFLFCPAPSKDPALTSYSHNKIILIASTKICLSG